MSDTAQIQTDMIPSFLGLPVGDLEDLVPGQVAIAGYFCDNLERPSQGQRYLARQLRYASVGQNVHEITGGIADEIASGNAIDLGDVNVFPLEPDKHFSAVVSQCEAVLTTGARMVLVGGDCSGLKALGIAAGNIKGADVPVVSISEDITKSSSDHLRNTELAETKRSDTEAIILSVDLQKLAAIWVSQPHRLAGMSPAQMITQINNTAGHVVAAAVFGLAPALDSRGSTETKAALAILQSLTVRLNKGAQ